jgi:hypothetical protein
VNGAGTRVKTIPNRALSKRRSSWRSSAPTSGSVVAMSASTLPAQSTASTVGQVGPAPSPGAKRAATAAKIACSSSFNRSSARLGLPRTSVERSVSGKAPPTTRSAPPSSPRVSSRRREGETGASATRTRAA